MIFQNEKQIIAATWRDTEVLSSLKKSICSILHLNRVPHSRLRVSREQFYRMQFSRMKYLKKLIDIFISNQYAYPTPKIIKYGQRFLQKKI